MTGVFKRGTGAQSGFSGKGSPQSEFATLNKRDVSKRSFGERAQDYVNLMGSRIQGFWLRVSAMNATGVATGIESTGRRGEPRQTAGLSDRLALAVAGITLSMMLGALCWGMNRGFDLNDEGLAALLANDPAGNPFFSSVGFFLHGLPHLTGNAVINLRVHHLLSRIIATPLMCAGFFWWLRAQRVSINAVQCATACALAVIGSLMTYAIYGQALSYNGMASAFAYIATGAVFGSCACATSRKSLSAAFSFIAGCSLALMFFVKSSSAVCFGVLLVALLGFLHKRKLLGFAAAAAGIGVACGWFFAFMQPPAIWWHILQEELRIQAIADHAPQVVLGNFTRSLLKHEIEVCFAAVGLAAALAAIRFSKRPGDLKISPLSVVFITALACIADASSSLRHSGLFHPSILYISLLPLLAIVLPRQKRTEPTDVKPLPALPIAVAISFMALAPFAISFGTNSPLLWHALNNFGLFYLALAAAYLVIEKQLKQPHFSGLSMSLLCVTSACVFYSGYIVDPHGTSSKFAAAVLCDRPARMRGLWLDSAAANGLQTIDDTLRANGFVDGDPILMLYRTPGVVYAVGGKPLGAPFYETITSGASAYINRIGDMTNKRMFVIISAPRNGKLPQLEHLELLKRHGIDLVHDFQIVGQFERPTTYFGTTWLNYIYARVAK